MTFGEPMYLILILVPVLAFLFAWKKTKKRVSSIRVLTRKPVHVRWVFLFLLGLGTICIIFAVAHPRWGGTEVPVQSNDAQLVIVLDVSRSMAADDIAPDRLTAAKEALAEILTRLTNERVALVIFAGDALLRFPLTHDLNAAGNVISTLTTGSILLTKGTNTSAGLELAHSVSDPFSRSVKLILLLSDGEDFSKETFSVATRFKDGNSQFLVAGVGTPQGGMVRAVDRFNGKPYYLLEEDGSPVISKLNENTLLEIAQAAEGTYLGSDLSMVSDFVISSMSSLGNKTYSSHLVTQPVDRFQVFTLIALLLIVIATIFELRRGMSRYFLWLGFLCCSIFFFVSCASNAWSLNENAIQSWNAGNFEHSVTLLYEAQATEPTNAGISLNLSYALFSSGRYEESIEFAHRAINVGNEDIKAMAYHNLARARFKLEDLASALFALKQTLLINPDDEIARQDYEIIYKILHKLKDQPFEEQGEADAGQSKNEQSTQSQDRESGEQKTGKHGNTDARESSNLSRAEVQQLLESIDAEIRELRLSFGEVLSAEEAYAMLELIEERSRLAGLRTSTGLETDQSAR